MDKVNTLIVSRLGLQHGYLDDIAAVDPRISVKDGTWQFVTELRKNGQQGAMIDRLEKETSLGRERQMLGDEEDLDTLLAQAEIIFATVLIPDNLLSRAPGLKWIHIGGAGIDRFLATGIFESGIMVTNSRGVAAIPIAEHCMAFMFALARNIPRLLSNKQNRRWERFVSVELRDRVVGIIGLGAIGGELARLARGIGMRVIAVRKSAARRESGVSGVDELYPCSELPQMLSESDFVVIAAPLTNETKGMIGEAELRTMKPTAYLINIARGQIVDQPALIRALKEGWIAGAGLDVFDIEPLPVENELWDLQNVILSPHMSGSTDRRSSRYVDMFCENLRRYLAGEQLLNIVDRRKGY